MCHEWIKQFPEKIFPKDSFFYIQGDSLDYCFYVLEGIGMQVINYENGVEIISKYRFPGGLMNVWGVMKNSNFYTSSGIAKTDIRIIVIPASAMRVKLNEDFAFYRWAVDILLKQNQYIYELYQKKTKGNAAEILCYSILSMSQTTSSGTRYLPKALALTDIAQHLRIHRVTVSHVFKALQEEQIIKKCSLGWQIIDEKQLERYSKGNIILNY